MELGRRRTETRTCMRLRRPADRRAKEGLVTRQVASLGRRPDDRVEADGNQTVNNTDHPSPGPHLRFHGWPFSPFAAVCRKLVLANDWFVSAGPAARHNASCRCALRAGSAAREARTSWAVGDAPHADVVAFPCSARFCVSLASALSLGSAPDRCHHPWAMRGMENAGKSGLGVPLGGARDAFSLCRGNYCVLH